MAAIVMAGTQIEDALGAASTFLETFLDSVADSQPPHPEATPPIAKDAAAPQREAALAVAGEWEASTLIRAATADETPREKRPRSKGVDSTVGCSSDAAFSEAETLAGAVASSGEEGEAAPRLSQMSPTFTNARSRCLLGGTRAVAALQAPKSSPSSVELMQSFDLPIFADGRDTVAAIGTLGGAAPETASVLSLGARAHVVVDDESSPVPLDASSPRTMLPEIIEAQESETSADFALVLVAEEATLLQPDDGAHAELAPRGASAAGGAPGGPGANKQQRRRYRICGKRRCSEEDFARPPAPAQQRRRRHGVPGKRRRCKDEGGDEEGGESQGEEGALRAAAVGTEPADVVMGSAKGDLGIGCPGIEEDNTVFGVRSQPTGDDLAAGGDFFTHEFKTRVNFVRRQEMLRRC